MGVRMLQGDGWVLEIGTKWVLCIYMVVGGSENGFESEYGGLT